MRRRSLANKSALACRDLEAPQGRNTCPGNVRNSATSRQIPALANMGSIWEEPTPPDRRWLWRWIFRWLAALTAAIALAWVAVQHATEGLPLPSSIATGEQR
jgi:hypothetical protein